MKSTFKRGIILFSLLLHFGCNKGEQKRTESNFDSNSEALQMQLKEKDDFINSYLKAFNEIQDNLNKIKEKEKIISGLSKSVELQKSNKEQIISDIQYIYSLLNKNRQMLVDVNRNLKKITVKNNELEKLNNNLINQISEQEHEINSLKEKLNTLQKELDFLKLANLSGQIESFYKTRKLNKVYFAIGTFDGLKKEGLIVEKGGIIGLGKITQISPNVSQDLFSALDMYDFDEISIAANEVKLVTTHPKSSYKFEDTKLKVKRLVILNPTEFWSVSKYLIVLVSSDKSLSKKRFTNDNSKLDS